MNETKFRELVAELDNGVPRATGAVRIVHREESLGVVATRQGALRLGIAILRAALQEPKRKNAKSVTDELADLSDDYGDWIEDISIVHALPEPDVDDDSVDDGDDDFSDDLDDDFAGAADDNETPGERRLNAGCGVMLLAAAYFAFFGFVKFAEAVVETFRPLF